MTDKSLMGVHLRGNGRENNSEEFCCKGEKIKGMVAFKESGVK